MSELLLLLPLFFIALQIGLAIWVGTNAQKRGTNGLLWGIVVLFTGLLGLILYLILRPGREGAQGTIQTLNAPTTVTPMSSSRPVDDDIFFAEAMKECESGQRKQGLWAKAFSEAMGDEIKAKAIYLRKKVDYVVVGEDPGSKFDKAKELGIKTLTEEEFKKTIG